MQNYVVSDFGYISSKKMNKEYNKSLSVNVRLYILPYLGTLFENPISPTSKLIRIFYIVEWKKNFEQVTSERTESIVSRVK